MKLALTRAIVDGIHNGSLLEAPTVRDPVFGFEVIAEAAGVPKEVLLPRTTWSDACAYDATAHRLATLFRENFKKFESGVSAEVRAAGPVG